MRILVIGGSGSLGRDLTRTLAKNHDVFAPPHGEVDLLLPDSLRHACDATGADAIINSAAVADVDICEREPDRAFAINADGVQHLAQVARERNARLVQISTDYVFAGTTNSPYTERDAPRPCQVYGRSKLAGERHALDVAPGALVVRPSWLFSAFGRNFPNRVLKAAREGGEVKAVRDWYGSPTSTVDLSQAIRALLEQAATGIVHVVNAGAQTRFEQAQELLAAIGSHRAKLVPIEGASLLGLPAARPRYTALATERLAALGVTMRDRAAAVREFVAS